LAGWRVGRRREERGERGRQGGKAKCSAGGLRPYLGAGRLRPYLGLDYSSVQSSVRICGRERKRLKIKERKKILYVTKYLLSSGQLINLSKKVSSVSWK
jgi:hypothetical protein